jgi:hypothetical protein
MSPPTHFANIQINKHVGNQIKKATAKQEKLQFVEKKVEAVAARISVDQTTLRKPQNLA